MDHYLTPRQKAEYLWDRLKTFVAFSYCKNDPSVRLTSRYFSLASKDVRLDPGFVLPFWSAPPHLALPRAFLCPRRARGSRQTSVLYFELRLPAQSLTRHCNIGGTVSPAPSASAC